SRIAFARISKRGSAGPGTFSSRRPPEVSTRYISRNARGRSPTNCRLSWQRTTGDVPARRGIASGLPPHPSQPSAGRATERAEGIGGARHVQQQTATGGQHAVHLPQRARAISHELQAQLAEDHGERLVEKGNRFRASLVPLDAELRRSDGTGNSEHSRVDIEA